MRLAESFGFVQTLQMTDRDWLDVSVRWRVYGLISSLCRSVFYVGITSRTVPERLQEHRVEGAVWDIIKDIEQAGGKIEFCEFAIVESEAAARYLERALIVALPQIFNLTHECEGKHFWKSFAGECELLGAKATPPSKPPLRRREDAPVSSQ